MKVSNQQVANILKDQATSVKSTNRVDLMGAEFARLNDDQKIDQVAKDFESIFIGLMLKSMRDTVPKSGLMDGGNAEDIYRTMLDAEYSKIMVDQNSTGLHKSIAEALRGSMKEAKNQMNTPSSQGLSAYSKNESMINLKQPQDLEKI